MQSIMRMLFYKNDIEEGLQIVRKANRKDLEDEPLNI